MSEKHDAELVKAALRMALFRGNQELTWCIIQTEEVNMQAPAIK